MKNFFNFLVFVVLSHSVFLYADGCFPFSSLERPCQREEFASENKGPFFDKEFHELYWDISPKAEQSAIAAGFDKKILRDLCLALRDLVGVDTAQHRQITSPRVHWVVSCLLTEFFDSDISISTDMTRAHFSSIELQPMRQPISYTQFSGKVNCRLTLGPCAAWTCSLSAANRLFGHHTDHKGTRVNTPILGSKAQELALHAASVLVHKHLGISSEESEPVPIYGTPMCTLKELEK